MKGLMIQSAVGNQSHVCTKNVPISLIKQPRPEMLITLLSQEFHLEYKQRPTCQFEFYTHTHTHTHIHRKNCSHAVWQRSVILGRFSFATTKWNEILKNIYMKRIKTGINRPIESFFLASLHRLLPSVPEYQWLIFIFWVWLLQHLNISIASISCDNEYHSMFWVLAQRP